MNPENPGLVVQLHEAIAAVCPIVGVSVGDPDDKNTWSIDYAPEATQDEKDAADAVLAAFDPFTAWVTDKVQELSDLVKNYSYTRYPNHRQVTLTKLLEDARKLGNSEAEDYIQGCWDWLSQVFAYYYEKEDDVVAIAGGAGTVGEKKTAIQAVIDGLDFRPLTAADPGVSIRHSMELLYGSSWSSSSSSA